MPRAVVFDVGKVLINFSFAGFQEFLTTRGANFENIADFISKTSLYEFEKGKISAEQFYKKVNQNLVIPASDAEIEAKWEDIFNPFQGMLLLLKEVSEIRPTYLLSNTNQTHWKYLLEKYDIAKHTQGYLTSFEAGTMKPDVKIYKKFSDKFGLKEEEILFIDDLIENIQAAQSQGWQTIHHCEETQTRAQISNLIYNS